MAAATFNVLEEWDRPVWVCDSFQGVPPPTDPADAGTTFHEQAILAVPLAEVRANFTRYGLLTDRVRFIEGWFADTLPGPVEELCVLRCDGDLYESTWQTLTALYDYVQPGGFVIIDDYGIWRGCQQAVDKFRGYHDIDAPLQSIKDGCGAVFWRVDK
jgi:O-methyltransferase